MGFIGKVISILLGLLSYLLMLVQLKIIRHREIIRIPLIGRLLLILFPVKK